MAKMIKITLTTSTIGASPKQRKVVEALGLKKMHHCVELAEIGRASCRERVYVLV